MGSLYYIGKRKRHRARRFFLSLFITVFLLILLFNKQLYPHIKTLTEAEITNRMTACCSEIIGKILAEANIIYEDLISIQKNAEGEITALSADMALLNTLRYKIAQGLLSALRQGDILSVSLPISNLFGILFLSGQGRSLSVNVQTASSMEAGFHATLKEAGINQTLHTVSFTMKMDLYYLLPIKTQKMTFTHSFCAAQTVIVGRVPDSLTQINRFGEDGTLLDDVTIDDAVDFGHIVN